MEINVYLHRTKKQDFKVCDCFTVDIDFEKLPEDKRNDIDFINQAFKNDCQRLARTRDCLQKYGTAYISFMRPQYEGLEEYNTGDIYFDNKEMLFVKREVITDEEEKK